MSKFSNDIPILKYRSAIEKNDYNEVENLLRNKEWVENYLYEELSKNTQTLKLLLKKNFIVKDEFFDYLRKNMYECMTGIERGFGPKISNNFLNYIKSMKEFFIIDKEAKEKIKNLYNTYNLKYKIKERKNKKIEETYDEDHEESCSDCTLVRDLKNDIDCYCLDSRIAEKELSEIFDSLEEKNLFE